MPKDIKLEFLREPRRFDEIMEKLEIIVNEMMVDDGLLAMDLGNVGSHDTKMTQNDFKTSKDMSHEHVCVPHNTLLDEKALDGYMWSGWRLTRKQLTFRPDHLCPEQWKSMEKHAKLKEKQKWSDEKLHLENARKLRGIYFIDPEDTEFKETIKNARKKLETSVAMPCKIMKYCGSGASDKIQTKLACILEAGESTRIHMGNSIPLNHEDHIAGKGENSLQYYNLVHKFIPMPQAMKILAAKAAEDKEWEKLEKFSAWNLTKVKSKKQVIDGQGDGVPKACR